MTEYPKFAVIGGGSWATAIAKMLCVNLPEIAWYMRNEEAIEHIVDLLAQRPTGRAGRARAPVVADELAAKPEPENQCDERGAGFLEFEQLVAEGAVTGENVNAAGGNLRHHKAAVDAPEHIGCNILNYC